MSGPDSDGAELGDLGAELRAEAASQLVQLAGAILIGFAFAYSQRLGSQPDLADCVRRRWQSLTGAGARRDDIEHQVRVFAREISIYEHARMGR